MTVYGTKINSDMLLPLELSHTTEVRYVLELSSNIPIGLKQSIRCGFPLYWAHGQYVYLYSDRKFEGNNIGQPWCYEVKDVVTFYWISGQECIYYELNRKGNPHLLGFWLIHLVLPLYMTLEERYEFLHAAAVEVDGKPILFMAPSMGGKSTLTDYFIKKGHRLISDDKVPTFIQSGRFMAVASHPYHRPYRKFQELGYPVENFSESIKPIHAIYLLNSADSQNDVTIDELKGFKKFDVLLPNYLYMFSHLKVKRLSYLAEMMNTIRVFSVQVPWDMQKLASVYQDICVHSKDFT